MNRAYSTSTRNSVNGPSLGWSCSYAGPITTGAAAIATKLNVTARTIRFARAADR